MHWKRSISALGVLAVFLLALMPGSFPFEGQETPEKPNVVLIMADDMTTSDLQHMPYTKRLLVDEGTSFENHTITLPTCCPSRTTFLRGQYAHNHEIGYGAYPSEQTFRNRGYARSTVGTWLDDEGYRTGYYGKYLNKFRQTKYVPPGWDRFYANADRDVWAREFASNGKSSTLKRGNIDAHLGAQGDDFLKTSGGPFFLWQNFNAPHQNHNGPPPAPEADLRKFSAKMPRTPAFNEADVSDKPGWIRSSPSLGGREITAMGEENKHRLASLQVVDRNVARLVDTLRRKGELDETYIFFTSDNGYHMGEHRMLQGKMTPYTTDVQVPLIVRGPGVAKDAVRDEMVQNTDFAPTAAELAGASTPDFVDGRSMMPLLEAKSGDDVPWREQAYFEGKGLHPFRGTTTEDGQHYVEYENGKKELYDLDADPHQMESLHEDPARADEMAALSARLAALKNCAADSCRAADGGP